LIRILFQEAKITKPTKELFIGPVAFFASYWSAGVERFRQPPALVSHWLGGFAGSAPTLIVSQSTLSLDNILSLLWLAGNDKISS